jgi:hypothetical protein
MAVHEFTKSGDFVMKRSFAASPFVCFALVMGLLAWSGCGGPSAPAPGAAGTEPAVDHDHDHDHEDGAGLSAVDQALADAQKICPVTGEELGSMGTPHKVMIEDRAVFLCCPPCEEALKEDPEKYLAKLDEAKSTDEAQPEATPEAEAKPEETPESDEDA